jgi:hypothetical protein
VTGYECFIIKYRSGSPSWLANPLLWFGCLALLIRRWVWAGIIGLIAVSFALSPLIAGSVPTGLSERGLEIGYLMWWTSMVLLPGGGFYGWWRSRRQGRAKDMKTTLPEIEPLPSGLDRDFDGS